MKIILLLCILTLSSCGQLPKNGKDGVNGSPGSNGSPGATGAAGPQGTPAIISSGPIGLSIGNGLTSCHHDYEYQSNNWLLVRHQENGTADQGAGSTGFNLWNVDIMNFSLISEQGGITYCDLQYDKAAGTLHYSVVGSSETGTIDLKTGNML